MLEAILRLLHPVVPFVTEELWQKVAPLLGIEGDTIMTRPFPQADSTLIDAEATAELEWVKTFVMGVRQIRSENDIKPGKPLPVVCQNGSDTDKARIEHNRDLLHALARLEGIDWLDGEPDSPDFATALVGEMKLLIPMAGLIDKQAEIERLQKNIEKNEQDEARLKGKLSNENFVSRAPQNVVDKEREKLADVETALANLRAQLQRIESI